MHADSNTRLGTVELNVADLDAQRAFYGDALGVGVTAYAFCRFGSHLTGAGVAKVVIDSDGRFTFNHHVTTVGKGADETVVSCYPLHS